MADDDNRIEAARIEIVRTIGDDGDNVWVQAADGEGSMLPLIESLGMLRLAEDTVIRMAMGEVPETDGE